MLLSPGMLVPSGPPPQRVLDKRMYWHVLVALLAMVAALRFATFDVVGGILSALMLCMACMMVADGMQELPRYSLVFGMLCVLCLFFDIVPLLASLSGRSEVSVQPVKRVVSDELTRITYTTTVRTTPFFDAGQGILYNVGSVSMLLSPMAMLLGAYLAVHAHIELHRYAQPFLGDLGDPAWWHDDFEVGDHDLGRPRVLGSSDSDHTSGNSQVGRLGGEGSSGPGQRHISRFQGVPRRLDV